MSELFPDQPEWTGDPRRIEDDEPSFEAVGLCHKCKHRRGLTNCAAFDQIPTEIMIGRVLHTRPYAGDRGIQFSQRFE